MPKQEDMREQIKEILTLVKECPEHLQEKCFELLFNHMISGKTTTKPTPDKQTPDTGASDTPPASSGDEIKLTDIHTKAKALIKGTDITIADINNLFYKEGGEFLPLYDDLKTTKMADSQMRLALLDAFKNALKDGEFRFLVEDVRNLCDTHKCYDKGNFSANFRNNKNLFQNEYKRGVNEITLSHAGKKELARIVLEIAR